MTNIVSDRFDSLVNKFFSGCDKDYVITLLTEQCGNNLPLPEKYSINELERIRFAAIKISDGNIDGLKIAIDLANVDWRDLLVRAGFADDVNSHNKWADTVLL